MSELKGKRVLLYARVSTEEQARNGESILDQKQALDAWVKKHGCIVAGCFVDEGFSARKPYKSRPALCALLSAVETGSVDAIVFTKLDRWFRNVRDYSKVQEVLERHGVFWMATLEDYETRTSAGRFKVNLMLSLAEHEADQTSERIKFTFQQKRARGEIISGNMPKGYRLVNGKPEKDPATEKGIAAFWAEYLSGAGMYAAMEKSAENGVPMPASSGSFLLRNAAHYAGQIQGCPCEPYITEAQRDWILSTRKKAPRKSGHAYLFSGIIYCAECGSRLGGHRNIYKKKSGEQKVQIYYNCTRHYRVRPFICPSRVNIDERDIEAALLAELDNEMEWCATAAEIAAKARKTRNVSSIAEKIKRLEAKRERCVEMYIDGLIDKSELEKRRTSISTEINTLKEEIADEQPTKTPEEIRATLPPNWRVIYEKLDAEHRRRFWAMTLSRIEVSIDRKVGFSLLL